MNDSVFTDRAEATPDALRSSIAGDVIGPADDGYDTARQAFNLALDLRPALIAIAESADDVVEIVRYARSAGMRVAPRSTGHGAAPMDDLDNAILLKTSRMRGVEIFPDTSTARVEAGAEWQDVSAPAAEHGLAALAGSSPDVGVVGYTLGGGLGWLARRYGLSANSVTAVELVTPDGNLVRAEAATEPDLFWALCGGGGGVGVVTAMEIALYPVREVYAGALFFEIERSAEVLHAWRKWTDSVPDEVTSVGRIMRFPPIPDVPEPLRGNSFAIVEAAYLGDEADGAELTRPLRELGPMMDTFGMIPAPALALLHMDPPEPVPYEGDGLLLADAPGDAIDAMVAVAGPDSGSALLSVELRHLGGALAEATGDGPQAKLDGKYGMFAVGMTMTPEMGEAVGANLRAVKEAFDPWRAEYRYFNFVESPAEADVVVPPEAYPRLGQIKAKYDPEESVITVHPVRPRPSRFSPS
jgi:hypothetical protein